MSVAPLRTVAPALFVISAVTFLLQIGLTRVFAYTIWHHFAFLVIAAALLGFGASGSVLMLRKRTHDQPIGDLLGRLAISTAVTTAIACIWITRVPLDPFRIAQDLSEGLRLVSYLVVITVPFFFAGSTVIVALSRYPAAAGRLYFADLAGAAAACALVVVLMNTLGPRRLLVACVLLSVVAAVITSEVKRRRYALVGGLALLAAAINAEVGDFTPAASKLAAKYAGKGGEIIYSRWSAVFRTDLYDFDDSIPFDADPSLTTYGTKLGGTGKTFSGQMPPYRIVAHDGDACAVMVRNRPEDQTPELLRHHLLGLSYRMKPGAKVFMGGVGGGIDLVSAVAGGVKSVHGVELDANTVDIVCRAHSDYLSDVCNRPNVHIEAGDGRSVIRRSRERFDIVNFTSVDTITSAATGAYLLSEGYLYTVEAMSDYLDHLAPSGIVSIISGDVGHPWGLPRWTPRIANVAATALEQRGVKNPSDHIVIVASFLPEDAFMPHTAMFVKNEPFTAPELERLDGIVQEEGFVFWHRPSKAIETSASQLIRSAPDERQRRLDAFHLDYSAPTDDQPFFMHFYKWENLLSYSKFDARYIEATGNVVLLAGLAFAVLGAVLLIAVPAMIAARRTPPKTGRGGVIGYFAALGVAFMFIEIALVQRLVLLLGYPTYSLTVTLFALLAFAALGSFLTRNLPATRRNVILLVVGLSVLSGAHYLLGDIVERALLPSPLPLRVFAAIVLLVPLGTLLGAFLPLGIRAVGERDPDAVPLAWAANGTTSVIGTVLSVILATLIGFRGVLLIALAIYWFAILVFPAPRRRTAGVEATETPPDGAEAITTAGT